MGFGIAGGGHPEEGGEIQVRYRGDAIQVRYRGDAGEIQGRYPEEGRPRGARVAPSVEVLVRAQPVGRAWVGDDPR